MSDEPGTTIRLRRETARALNQRKHRFEARSMDETITRLLNETAEA